MKTPDQEKPPTRRPGLLVLPFLLLAGLLLAPPTQPLFLAQLHMLRDSGPFFPPLAEFGVKEGPIAYVPPWKQRLAEEGKRRFPDDYAVQIGAALLWRSNRYIYGSSTDSRQDHYKGFQSYYGESLGAIIARFPNRPGSYAHLLRFMTQGAVRVSRDAEIAKFQPDKTSLPAGKGEGPAGAFSASFGGGRSFMPFDKQIGYAESWEAYDQAAAQGEKLDPDNAYFPLMRAIGLFDAKRDAEGIAAVLRAGQKSRFDDYANEEAEAEWTLCRRVYGPSSILVRQNISGAVYLPHLASLRAVSRLTAYFAEKAEREGRTLDGLALRHAMMQCGILMREQGYLLAARTGIAIVSFQTNQPGGMQTLPPLDDNASKQDEDRHRDLYPAYLHQIRAEEEALWFAGVDATDRQVRALLDAANKEDRITVPIRSLPSLWMADMMLLTNMLVMLLFCTAAAVCARLPKGGEALPGVVLVLLMCGLYGALTMRCADALTQLRWLLETEANISWQGPDFLNVSRFLMQFPAAIHIGEVLFALVIPVLTLVTLGVGSAVRREAFPIALSRGLQQGALHFATLLTVVYVGALIATVQAESRGADGCYGLRPYAVTALQHHQKRSSHGVETPR